MYHSPRSPVHQSLRTVFQLRPVPRVASVFSMSAVVRRERPMPSG